MHRATAAEGHEDVFARVMAFADRYELDGVDHVRVGEANNSPGHLVHRHPELARELFGRLARLLERQRHLTPQEIARVDAAEQQVGVGDSGLSTALCVARGTGHRTGAPGTNTQRSDRIKPGDRTTAGSDLD